MKRIFDTAARFALALSLLLAGAEAANAELAPAAPATGEPVPALRSQPVMPSDNPEYTRPSATPVGTNPSPTTSFGTQPGGLPAGALPTGAAARARLPVVDPATEQLTATIAALREDLQRVQTDSARSEAANQRLQELNGQLRQEVESLALELQAARAGVWQRWLLYGAGLLLIGVLTGVVIKARPRRSAWS